WPRPARRNESTPSRWSRAAASSCASRLRRNQLADLVELLGCRPVRSERLQHELRRRSVEEAIQKVGDELALGLILGERRLIHVRARRLVAAHEPLLR